MSNTRMVRYIKVTFYLLTIFAALAANSFLLLFVFPPVICFALFECLIWIAFPEGGADLLAPGPLCFGLYERFGL